MGGQTSFSIKCSCGYEGHLRVGNYYRKIDKPWVEVFRPTLKERFLDFLYGRPQKITYRVLREHIDDPLIPCLDHASNELIEVCLSDAKRDSRYTPIAIAALENAGPMRGLAMTLEHPGPRLTCPQCGGEEIRSESGLHATVLNPDYREMPMSFQLWGP